MKKPLLITSYILTLLLLLSFAGGCSTEVDIAASGCFDEEPGEYYLNYYITRSPYGLDWESPSTLARTLLVNAVPSFLGTSSTILGHVNFELKCDGAETIYAGMGYKDRDEPIKLIFNDKSGLGLLFHNMAGRFDAEEDINDAKAGFINGNTSIITFTFNEERCRQIKEYVEAYLEKGEHYNYGLDNNPFLSASKGISQEVIDKFPQNRKGIPLGAGCTAFGVSALQELGITDMDTFKQWYSRVRAPEEFIGQYSDQIYTSPEEQAELHPMNRNTGKEVSLWQIIFRADSWADEAEPGKDIVYYCPDLMFEWVEEAAEKYEINSEVLSGRLTSVEEAPEQGRSHHAYRLTIALDD